MSSLDYNMMKTYKKKSIKNSSETQKTKNLFSAQFDYNDLIARLRLVKIQRRLEMKKVFKTYDCYNCLEDTTMDSDTSFNLKLIPLDQTKYLQPIDIMKLKETKTKFPLTQRTSSQVISKPEVAYSIPLKPYRRKIINNH